MPTYEQLHRRRNCACPQNVEDTIPMLRGLVETYGKNIVARYNSNGDALNSVRFTSKKTGVRYYVGFCYGDRRIHLRRYSQLGPTLAIWDNAALPTIPVAVSEDHWQRAPPP
jgi:hypothetical protein